MHLALLLALCSLFLVACRSKETLQQQAPAASASAPAPPAAWLPPPYDAVRPGMTLAELTAIYPASEAIDHCQLRLVGQQDDSPPSKQQRADTENSAACATLLQASGSSVNEKMDVMGFLLDDNKPQVAAEKTLGWMNTMAQVRGSIRAGVVTEEQLLEATQRSPADAFKATSIAAAMLFDGAMAFVRPRQARRPISAVVSDDCSGIDAKLARRYVLGEFSLGELDQQARMRVANGKCRGAYVQHEGSMQREFVIHTGGLAGIGLARSSRPDRKLLLDTPSTYAVYSLRSSLAPGIARLGVQIANQLPETERFWEGAVALSSKNSGHLGVALVWLEQGKVTRVMVNIYDEKKLPAIRDELTKIHGDKGQESGLRVRWSLPGGQELTLDQGAALALRLGPAAAWQAPPAASSDPAASSR